MSDKLVPITINLNEAQGGVLNESWLRMFGSAVETILKAMFKGSSLPVSIRGNDSQVKAFAKALGGEKNYLQSWANFGMKDPKTAFSRAELDKAISQFERSTRIPWPFK